MEIQRTTSDYQAANFEDRRDRCAAWDCGTRFLYFRIRLVCNDSPYSFALKGLTRRIHRSLAPRDWSHPASVASCSLAFWSITSSPKMRLRSLMDATAQSWRAVCSAHRDWTAGRIRKWLLSGSSRHLQCKATNCFSPKEEL